MLYRPYQPDDFAALYAIEELCFQPPQRFSRATMRRLLGQSAAAAWIAEDNAQMCGFAIVEWNLNNSSPSAYIQTIEVIVQGRGQGIGRELMRCVEGSASAAGAVVIWLHVDVCNQPALRLYHRCGYQPQGRTANYYGPGTEALILAKHLLPIHDPPA